MKRWSLIFLWLWCLSATAAEIIPPKPEHYFNDYAHVVDPATADQLNMKLDKFERDTSDQVVVAIYPKMQSDSSIDDYAVRVFRSWKVGQEGKNNGVVLFIFINDRKMFIEVGYGLEGALPDATCKQITEYQIKPHFKNGDYTGGVVAGVNSILAATHGEFKGNGTTVAEKHQPLIQNQDLGGLIVDAIIVLVILLPLLTVGKNRRRGWLYTGSGWGGGGWGGGWGGGGGGGGWSGSGGGGGFLGGGGSSGGGGAGSSW